MSSGSAVSVFGSSGFVGAAVARALGDKALPVHAPRVKTAERETEALLDEARRLIDCGGIAPEIRASVVVNAAGMSDASSLDDDALFGANALWPAVLGLACLDAGVARLVHISSAVVQYDRPVLDASEEMQGFTPYSRSKVAGELVFRSLQERGLRVVRYRPPSVHANGRRVTLRIARLARSPFASVARPGNQPTPQALLKNVGAAVAFLASSDIEPPPVVIHPWEGCTVESLMFALGGKAPRRIPNPLARGIVLSSKALGALHPPTAANARRLEMLWLGQGQEHSWLTEMGWSPPVQGPDAWAALVTS